MPRLLVMSDVVLRCQRRADMENDDTIKPPEWKALVSEQYGHLYSTVVKAGLRYFESSANITANGAASYAVPSDHDMTIGIERVLDSTGRTAQLGELMIQERNVFGGQTGDAVAYMMVGSNVTLHPRPSSGTYVHTYIPQSPDLSSLPDLSTIDVVTSDGEAFLIYGVAVKAKAKRKEDVSLDIRERDEAMERFAEDVTLRAFVNPRRRVVMPTIADTDYDWGIGYDPASWRYR